MSVDIGKLRAIVAKSAQLYERWMSAQEIACRLMANAGNILERLPAIQDLRSYEGFPDAAATQRRLVAAQMTSFENVLQRLAEAMRSLSDAVQGQEKLCVESWSILASGSSGSGSSSKSGGAAGAAGMAAGASSKVQPSCGASIAQMVEAMEDVWYMCRDELCLKAAIISRIHHAMDYGTFGQLAAVFSENVNMRPTSTSALLLLNFASMSG